MSEKYLVVRMRVMNQPLVSVCISVYNGERFIEKAIRSVTSQSYRNLQIIVVDDGSTDSTLSVIKSIQDDRIEIYSMERNRHMCYGFNEALFKAKGEYIAHMDADDIWYENKIEKQILFLISNREYGACFSYLDFIDEEDNVINDEHKSFYNLFRTENKSQAEWIRRFFKGNCLSHPSVLMRSEILQTVGIYSYTYLQLQDFDYWIRIVKKYPIYVLPEDLMQYRLCSSDTNCSTWTPTRVIRRYGEFLEIIYNMLSDIPRDIFIEAFKDEFRYKGQHSDIDLECEKAFLLLDGNFCGKDNKVLGIRKLREIMKSHENIKVLEEHFNFTLLDFYKISVNKIYYDFEEIK